MSDHKQEFWDRLDDVQAGMLGTDQDDMLVPMSPNLRDGGKDGQIWFITAKGTDIVNHLEAGARPSRLIVADAKSGLYAHIKGDMAISNDRAVLDEIWSPVAAAWFEDGKDDPDIRLVRFTPRVAEASGSTTSAVKFFYETAKANLTGAKPNEGWNATLTF